MSYSTQAPCSMLVVIPFVFLHGREKRLRGNACRHVQALIKGIVTFEEARRREMAADTASEMVKPPIACKRDRLDNSSASSPGKPPKTPAGGTAGTPVELYSRRTQKEIALTVPVDESLAAVMRQNGHTPSCGFGTVLLRTNDKIAQAQNGLKYAIDDKEGLSGCI
uniref:Uncharacterized protein n=1 Tax=Glossina austeni TaxID=7395 RepID=A0A1A9V0P4_GLOAU